MKIVLNERSDIQEIEVIINCISNNETVQKIVSQEVCLMEQPFVKDPDMNVEKMIAAKAPGTKIIAFTRYKMGDGLEKKVNDLAAEVAEQIGK